MPVRREGRPLWSGAVEESRYTAGVPDQEYGDLTGFVLASVEGEPLAKVRERQRRLRGMASLYVPAMVGNEGDGIGEALQQAVDYRASVWVRDGPADWAWLRRQFGERLGIRAGVGRTAELAAA